VDDPDPRSAPGAGDAVEPLAAHGGADDSDAATATDTDSPNYPNSLTDVSDARLSRRPRSARDPLDAAVDAELAKRRRVVAVRLSEVEHLAWRREAAADKRGQLGAWTRSVVGAEIARRHSADVPGTVNLPPNRGGMDYEE